MEDVINKIVISNKSLFGSNPIVEKINIGFTNTLYSINNSFIVKICTNISNEEKFKKEINFYNSNKDNDLIPKLYYSCIDKKDVPYMYEIIEKIDGESLYNVWYKLDENERENIIKQLCDAMKKFHSKKSEPYNWNEKTKNIFTNAFEKVKELKIFSEKEIELINEAYSKFDNYLNSNEFVLVHNDLHFDNIFYKDGKIKLIDFERSLYSPRDFELDIIYRMVRKPWKFASEKTEKYVNKDDYSNIMKYIEKYYPEIFIKNNYKRLAIYDLVYYIKQIFEYPNSEELKNDILNAVEKILESNI